MQIYYLLVAWIMFTHLHTNMHVQTDLNPDQCRCTDDICIYGISPAL